MTLNVLHYHVDCFFSDHDAIITEIGDIPMILNESMIEKKVINYELLKKNLIDQPMSFSNATTAKLRFDQFIHELSIIVNLFTRSKYVSQSKERRN